MKRFLSALIIAVIGISASAQPKQLTVKAIADAGLSGSEIDGMFIGNMAAGRFISGID